MIDERPRGPDLRRCAAGSAYSDVHRATTWTRGRASRAGPELGIPLVSAAMDSVTEGAPPSPWRARGRPRDPPQRTLRPTSRPSGGEGEARRVGHRRRPAHGGARREPPANVVDLMKRRGSRPPRGGGRPPRGHRDRARHPPGQPRPARHARDDARRAPSSPCPRRCARRRAGPPPQAPDRSSSSSTPRRGGSSGSSPSATCSRPSATPTPPRTPSGASASAPPSPPRPTARAHRRPRPRGASTCWWSTPRTATQGRHRRGAGHEGAAPPTSWWSRATSPPPRPPRPSSTPGADAIKVGIGPGSICTTRVVAGVGIAAGHRHQRLREGGEAARRVAHLRRRHQVLGRRRQRRSRRAPTW